MGFIEFIIICFIVVAIAFAGTWAVGQIPGCPPIVIRIIWGVAIFIIVVMLLRAVGLFGHDPMIPKVG